MEIIEIIVGLFVLCCIPLALNEAGDIAKADHFARKIRKSIFED
jgi:hypothetical protein|tara:strand:- start:18535 stop:18666 length:132 start_codon:yes stop_codon:yes gene_type:complete